MMDKLDQLIEEALRDEDRAIMEATEELGWFHLGMKQFGGKLGWVAWVIMVVQATLFIAGVWCAVQFFGSADMLSALKWGLSGAVLIIVATQLKLSLMPQIQADRVLREVKRLELLILEHRQR
jgi:Family of unknown function (DUF6768)